MNNLIFEIYYKIPYFLVRDFLLGFELVNSLNTYFILHLIKDTTILTTLLFIRACLNFI